MKKFWLGWLVWNALLALGYSTLKVVPWIYSKSPEPVMVGAYALASLLMYGLIVCFYNLGKHLLSWD